MERKAVVVIQGWAGRSEVPVTIVGETNTRWRVRLDGNEPQMLAGRNVWRQPGEIFLVPKTAVRLID
jgi:hypothetical protein